MDAREAYHALNRALQEVGFDNRVTVPTATLGALLDGIDLDDPAPAGPLEDPVATNREAQLARLTTAYSEADLKLVAIKELATVWRNETDNRMVSSDDHDIKRVARLLLDIIR